MPVCQGNVAGMNTDRDMSDPTTGSHLAARSLAEGGVHMCMCCFGICDRRVPLPLPSRE